MNSKNKKIIKERMFTMNLKNKKIFSRIAAGVMTVAMAITLLPGTMKTVNAAESVTSASVNVTLYKRANVYAPNTTFQFTVTNLTAAAAKTSNGGTDLTPEFKDAPENAVTAGTITLSPTADAGKLNDTSITKTLTFTLVPSKFTDIGTYRYKVQQNDLNYEGIKYDTTEKYLDVIVARNGDTVYIENAFLISYKNETRNKIQEVVNTYGVNKPDTENPDPKPDGTVNDLVISKNVTGIYGERDKDFNFDITINGAEDESYYLVRLPEKSGDPEVKIAELKSGVNQTITLRHGQKVKIYGLTASDNYKIEEATVSGYTTKFETKVGGTVIGDGTVTSNSATGAIEAKDSLQTQEVAFTNNREAGAATGFALSYGPYALMVVLAGAVAFVLFRKRRAEY